VPATTSIAHSETRNLKSTDQEIWINFDSIRTTYKNALMLLMLKATYRPAPRCHGAVRFSTSVVGHEESIDRLSPWTFRRRLSYTTRSLDQ
jgi:hypothetical protein